MAHLHTRSVQDALGHAIAAGVERGQRRQPGLLLAAARDDMLRSLVDVLTIADPSRVRYLSPLMGLLRQQGFLTIATLNYDLAVEELARLEAADCDTGIETWLKQGELGWEKHGLRLLKLHGSIDWVIERSNEPHSLPLRRVRKESPDDWRTGHEQPAVVFGEGGKLRSEGPYLELLLAWSAQLKQASDLLVIGYSFRDGTRERPLKPLDEREGRSSRSSAHGVLDPAPVDVLTTILHSRSWGPLMVQRPLDPKVKERYASLRGPRSHGQPRRGRNGPPPRSMTMSVCCAGLAG